jgi:hypothetical protein
MNEIEDSNNNKFCQVILAICTYYIGTFVLIYYLEKRHYFGR